MHPSRHVFLINDNCRAITVQYDPDAVPGMRQSDKTLKTLDASIKKDDIVVIETGTRAGYTCVKVIDVDVDIDIESDMEIHWAVDKVDTARFNQLRADEAEASSTIQAVTLKAKREELRSRMQVDKMDGVKTLNLTDMSKKD